VTRHIRSYCRFEDKPLREAQFSPDTPAATHAPENLNIPVSSETLFFTTICLAHLCSREPVPLKFISPKNGVSGD
jgi:hypothetical protein